MATLEQIQAREVERVVCELLSAHLAAGAENGSEPEMPDFKLAIAETLATVKAKAPELRDPDPVTRLREGADEIRAMMRRVSPSNITVQRKWTRAVDSVEDAILWYESGRGAVLATRGMP